MKRVRKIILSTLILLVCVSGCTQKGVDGPEVVLSRIIIPDVKFDPPATLIDAMDFFKQASRDYDDPKIPLEKRGVSLILRLREHDSGTRALADNEDPFAVPSADREAPVLPSISVRFISLYDALRLVCDVTGYKFDTRGGFVMITPKHDITAPINKSTDTKNRSVSDKNTR